MKRHPWRLVRTPTERHDKKNKGETGPENDKGRRRVLTDEPARDTGLRPRNVIRTPTQTAYALGVPSQLRTDRSPELGPRHRRMKAPQRDAQRDQPRYAVEAGRFGLGNQRTTVRLRTALV